MFTRMKCQESYKHHCVQISPHRTASIALNSSKFIKILILISVKHFIVCCCYMTCLCDVQ